MQNLEEEGEECVQAKADYCQHFVGNAIVSVVLISVHVFLCVPYSYSLLSLMEYVQLYLLAAYTWLSWNFGI